MKETILINPLGDTKREQWENAVRLYCMSIRTCIDDAYSTHDEDEKQRRLDAAFDTLNSLQDEVIRFMEGAFNIIEEVEADGEAKAD